MTISSKYFYRRTFLCQCYTDHLWNKPAALGLFSTGTGKELACRNYVPGQTFKQSANCQNMVCNWLKTKLALLTVGENTCNLSVQATKIKEGILGFNFMLLLERRLDNVVYRLGLATTRRQAFRQFVNHGHILLTATVGYPIIPRNSRSSDLSSENHWKCSQLEAAEELDVQHLRITVDAEKLEGSLTCFLPRWNQPRNQRSTCRWIYNKML